MRLTSFTVHFNDPLWSPGGQCHMNVVGCKYDSKQHSLSSIWLCALAWMTGLLFGLVFAICCRERLGSMVSMVYPLLFDGYSRLLFTILPFLLSAYAVSYLGTWFLFLVCSIKATMFSVGCFLQCLCYGQAGWLACWLFMFCDICSLPLFLYSCIGNFGKDRHMHHYEHIIICVILVALFVIDYRIVMPYAKQFEII